MFRQLRRYFAIWFVHPHIPIPALLDLLLQFLLDLDHTLSHSPLSTLSILYQDSQYLPTAHLQPPQCAFSAFFEILFYFLTHPPISAPHPFLIISCLDFPAFFAFLTTTVSALLARSIHQFACSWFLIHRGLVLWIFAPFPSVLRFSSSLDFCFSHHAPDAILPSSLSLLSQQLPAPRQCPLPILPTSGQKQHSFLPLFQGPLAFSKYLNPRNLRYFFHWLFQEPRPLSNQAPQGQSVP